MGQSVRALTLVRILAPHFCAGLETDGVVRNAAPILGYMIGWRDDEVRAYVRKMGWQARIIRDERCDADI